MTPTPEQKQAAVTARIIRPTITSTRGRDLIKSFEGCRLTSYQDQGGVWTIGYGHTAKVTNHDTITQLEADSLFEQDLFPCHRAILNGITAPIAQGQFDALASFIFNLGVSPFNGSTLRRLINAGTYSLAAQEFPKWDHEGGPVIPGLLKRRLAEQALFLSV